MTPRRSTTGALTVYAVTLGCPKNRVDTEVMLGDLLSHGWELAPGPGEADVLLVNTCGFLEEARGESIDVLRDLERRMKPGARLVAAGCMAGDFRKEISREVPRVSTFVGTREILNMRNRIEGRSAPFRSVPGAANPRLVSTLGGMAYLKVADGCSRRCSFCLIPRIKGRQHSRPVADLVDESKNLASTGARELVLVAQDLVHYGHDLPERPSLASLVAAISSEVPDLHWMRLMYLFPRDVGDDLLDVVAGSPNVLPYLDIPVQHSDDRVLAAMRRGTTGRSLEALVDRVRTKVPGSVLRTTYMVGFPGEDDAAFENLLTFARAARFEMAGVFRFSAEPGARASSLPGQVPEAVKAEREARLQGLLDEIADDTRREMTGEVHEAILESTSGGDSVGRFWFQAPEVDGRLHLRGHRGRCGEFVKVRVTGAHGTDFQGSPA